MSEAVDARKTSSDIAEWQATRERRSVREEHRLLTRQRIIDSALEVFEQKGYAASTIEDVVVRAGVARGTFYLHFKNKLGIVQAAIAEELPAVMALYQDLDHLVTSGRGRTRANMRAWMTRAIDWFESNRTIATVWQELPSSEPDFEMGPSFMVANQMERYLSQWPESERGPARLRIILLVQQLARAFLLSNVRHVLGVDNGILIEVLSDLWLEALKPPQSRADADAVVAPRELGNARARLAQ